MIKKKEQKECFAFSRTTLKELHLIKESLLATTLGCGALVY